MIAEIELIFTEKLDNSLELLRKTVKSGKLGNLTVDKDSLKTTGTGLII